MTKREKLVGQWVSGEFWPWLTRVGKRWEAGSGWVDSFLVHICAIFDSFLLSNSACWSTFSSYRVKFLLLLFFTYR